MSRLEVCLRLDRLILRDVFFFLFLTNVTPELAFVNHLIDKKGKLNPI